MTDLRTEELDFVIPDSCIATQPASPRDSARLMVVPLDGSAVQHRVVRDLPDILHSDDTLVLNHTRVLPARFHTKRHDSGGGVEGLFLQEVNGRWQCFLKAGGRLTPGLKLDWFEGQHLVLDEPAKEGWWVRPEPAGSPEGLLAAGGATPLPPYIRKARKDRAESFADATDRDWYQTVFGDGRAASVAAPTASLHLTPELLQQFNTLRVELEVGAGTFKPVTTDRLADHPMHTERCHVPRATLEALPQATRRIAVGTTALRTLESLPSPLPTEDWSAETDLLIMPGHTFRWADGLLTNFHLARSTLLALVAAFTGIDRLRGLYDEAVQKGYRFHSSGDAMLLLPGDRA